MKRVVVTIVSGILLGLTAAAPAFAFPEQPGTHNQQGCTAVGTNPGTGPGGPFSQHVSPTASGILTPLYADACLGGA